MKKYRYYIGIDTGTDTGFSVWSRLGKELLTVDTMAIHKAIDAVRFHYHDIDSDTLVRVEDARLRTFIPKNTGRERLQGAGSIKRDAAIWEDFLKDLGIDYEMIAPKNNKTKMSDEYFKKVTGWKGRTSNHGRDAAMLVFGS